MKFSQYIGSGIVRVLGWKLVGKIPEDVRKCVIVVAPHTCIFDFIIGRFAYFALDTPVKFLIKKEFFDNMSYVAYYIFWFVLSVVAFTIFIFKFDFRKNKN